MPKKSRTPAPPVKAPRRREPTTGGGGLSRRTMLVGAAALAAGAIAVGVAVVLASGGGANAAEELAAAGCTLKTYPSLGQAHVQSLKAKPKYNSFPPTSGPHYFQPAIWDFYTEPLVQVQGVHNLEHGGIVIQYGREVPASTAEELRGFYNDDADALVVAPLPALGSKIVLTAWTHLATCPRFDEGAFKAFRDAYRFRGPEAIPRGNLKPGT